MKFLNNSDFEKIEQALNITLPEHYKKFHLEKHDLLTRLQTALAKGSEEGTTYLSTDADNIINENTNSADIRPPHLMIIGTYEGGDLPYFMNVSPNSTDEKVYTVSFDASDLEDEPEDEFKPSADNLESHVVEVCETLEYVISLK